MDYSESMEMYLETILDLSKNSERVQSIDIARKLEVSKPSVNRALGILKNDGLIEHERYGSVKLTDAGQKIAGDLRNKHDCIRRYLVQSLKLDPEVAEKDACRMEHILSPETLEAIKKYFPAD